jgi:prophage regulatory protein
MRERIKIRESLQDLRIVRLPELTALLSTSKTNIWRMEKAGEFPRGRIVGLRGVGWCEAEIREWIESRKKRELSAIEGENNDKKTP